METFQNYELQPEIQLLGSVRSFRMEQSFIRIEDHGKPYYERAKYLKENLLKPKNKIVYAEMDMQVYCSPYIDTVFYSKFFARITGECHHTGEPKSHQY